MASVKSFRVPIFGARIFFTRDRDEAQKWEDKRGMDTTLGSVDGICSYNNGYILIYIKRDCHALLAHECLHAANYALEYNAIEGRDEELLACLLEWIMGECLKRY